LQNPYETAAPLLSFDHADKYYTTQANECEHSTMFRSMSALV
jgi:hypothetical protein